MGKDVYNPLFAAELTIIQGGATQPLEHPVALQDELKKQRRNKIAEAIKKRFEEKSLQERLANQELTTANVLREGLFGFLPGDDTLLIDLYPQGNAYRATDKITYDPLWQHMLEYFTVSQKANIIAMFETIKQFAPRLEDEAQSQTRKRQLRHDHLITLSDTRQVPLEGWLSLVNLGTNRANLIFGAVKKIE
jgi:hypothetical protein